MPGINQLAWGLSRHTPCERAPGTLHSTARKKFARGTSSVKHEQIIFIRAAEESEEPDPFLLHAPRAWARRESQRWGKPVLQGVHLPRPRQGQADGPAMLSAALQQPRELSGCSQGNKHLRRGGGPGLTDRAYLQLPCLVSLRGREWKASVPCVLKSWHINQSELKAWSSSCKNSYKCKTGIS